MFFTKKVIHICKSEMVLTLLRIRYIHSVAFNAQIATNFNWAVFTIPAPPNKFGEYVMNYFYQLLEWGIKRYFKPYII